MKPIIFAVIFVTTFLIHAAAFAQEQEGCAVCKMKVESIAVGMKAADVKKQLGAPAAAGKYKFDGECTSTYSATWSFPAKGLEVIVTADDAAGKGAAVSEIRLTFAATTKLQGDIGIGNSEADVKKVFGKYQTDDTREHSAAGKQFMVGENCQAVDFEFKQGKVSRIRIGMTYCGC